MASDTGTQSEQEKRDREKEVSITYDLPYVTGFLRRVRCCAYVPFLPSFNGFLAARKSAGKADRPVPLDGSTKVGYQNKSFDTGPDH